MSTTASGTIPSSLPERRRTTTTPRLVVPKKPTAKWIISTMLRGIRRQQEQHAQGDRKTTRHDVLRSFGIVRRSFIDIRNVIGQRYSPCQLQLLAELLHSRTLTLLTTITSLRERVNRTCMPFTELPETERLSHPTYQRNLALAIHALLASDIRIYPKEHDRTFSEWWIDLGTIHATWANSRGYWEYDWGPFRFGWNVKTDDPVVDSSYATNKDKSGESVHPQICINDGTVCIGSETGTDFSAVKRFFRTGRIDKAFMLIRAVLATYNAASCYQYAHEWEGLEHTENPEQPDDEEESEEEFDPSTDPDYGRCELCGEYHMFENLSYCQKCEEYYCEQHSTHCTDCHMDFCGGCSTLCDRCGDSVCDECLETFKRPATRGVQIRDICKGCRTELKEEGPYEDGEEFLRCYSCGEIWNANPYEVGVIDTTNGESDSQEHVWLCPECS